MKTKLNFYLLCFLFLFISNLSFGQSAIVTASINVHGNCTMCKQRIEKALDHKGIKQADWNVKTKTLTVVYNSAKISEQQIHEIVAAAGHDTDKVKAPDEVYAALPFCCLYRDGEESETKKTHHQ